MKSKFLKTFAFLLFTSAFCLATVAQTLTVRDIMREPSIAGMRPENEKLSPDGKTVVFSWNAEGKEPRNLYIASTGGGKPEILVDAEKNYELRTPAPESKLNYGLNVRDDFAKAREKNLGGAEFSPNSKRLLFTQNSDIYVLEISDKVSSSRRITRTQGAEFAAQWLDDATILYQSNGNFFALNIDKTSLVQLSKEANPTSFISVSFPAPTEDAMLLAYIVSDSSKQRTLYLPNYLDEYVQAPTFRRGFTEQKILVVKTDGSLEKPFEIKIPKAEGASYLRSLDWAADNRSLIVDRVDKDTKRRQLFYIYNVGSKDEQIITLTEETDEKWIGSLSRIVEPNPKDNSQILFASERDGYNHLYLATLEKRPTAPNTTGEIRQENPSSAGFTPKVEIKQLTKGSFEIDWAKWLADGKQIIFSSTEQNTTEREFYSLFSDGKNKLKILTGDSGMKLNPQLSTKETGFSAVSTNESNSKTQLKAEQTLRRIKNGEDFAKVAKEVSDDPVNKDKGGHYVNIERGKFIKEFEDAAFALNPGQITNELIRTRNGYEIIKLEDKRMEKGIDGSEKVLISLRHILISDSKKELESTKSNGSLPILLYQFSKWNLPTELYSARICLHCSKLLYPEKLTTSIPENFKQRKWNAPKFIDIPARDGKIIKSKIYTPADFDKSKKYPMVIFVHGAGYLQNTINGWNNYYREFMFNQMLTQKGYVVLDIDYRGSAGYGRDFRTDVYDFLGGKDYEDELDAIDYAVKNYAVDAKKIGVYGGSYGGFMAEMLAFRSDKITCAAALRPVADWKNYFASSPVYTTERLGFPDKNPEGYKRSSPISYAETLNKPLLILHGLVDDNVPAQDSMQLIEKLIRLEKTEYFEAMLYPAESHGFQRPTSWTDEYGRILTFFEKHLKN